MTPESLQRAAVLLRWRSRFELLHKGVDSSGQLKGVQIFMIGVAAGLAADTLPAAALGGAQSIVTSESFLGISQPSVIELQRVVGLDGDSVTSVDWNPDGTLIAISGGRPETQVWKATDLTRVRKLDGGAKGFAGGSQHSVAFSADGRWLASGYLQATLWDTVDWQPKVHLSGPSLTSPQPFGIRSIVFSSDQTLVIVGYQAVGNKLAPVVAFHVADGTVAWTHQLGTGAEYPHLCSELVTITQRDEIAFAEWGFDAAGERFSRISMLAAKSGRLTRRIERIHVDAATALAVSADGRYLATATNTGQSQTSINTTTRKVVELNNQDPIRIWDAASGSLAKELPVNGRSWSLAFSPDGRYLIAGQSESPGNSSLNIWNLGSGAFERVSTPRELGVSFGLAFSAQGSSLVAVGQGIAIFKYRAAH